MKTCNGAHEAAVRQALARVLGTTSFTLAPMPTYPDSIVYRADADARSVVFKAVDPDGRDRDAVAVEAWACERARARGVPAPAVVEVDTSGSTFPASWFVMECATGVALDSLALEREEATPVLRAVGGLLRGLHEEVVGGFGPLTDSPPRGAAATWRAAVLDAVPGALRYLCGVVPGADADALLAAVDAEEATVDEPAAAVLLHGDLGTTHVFVDPVDHRVTGIVDFGECAAGDPRWDLVEIEPWAVAAVADGYEIATDARDALDAALRRYRLLKAVPWAARWHARGEVQVLDWLHWTVHDSLAGSARIDASG